MRCNWCNIELSVTSLYCGNACRESHNLMKGAVNVVSIGGDKMFRQGDLLIVPVESVPKGLPEEDPSRDMIEGIVERGETSGHAHRLRETVMAQARRFVGDPAMYLEVQGGGTALVHEEHAPIDLGPGTYKVIRQREFDPAADQRERMVID